jgi:hypothetical protein
MKKYWLKFTLLSDTTFGRGDGVAGLVDTEVQHDSFGLPFLSGKTLKGLLMAECAEILDALRRFASEEISQTVTASAQRLFGDPGSTFEQGKLHIGDARLPADLRNAIAHEFSGKTKAERGQLRSEYLNALTELRRQTAMDVNGAPKHNTLRTIRVILRETPFEASLEFLSQPEPGDEALLGACVKAFRRVGTNRHRGRGRMKADLYSEGSVSPQTDELFGIFRKVVQQ